MTLLDRLRLFAARLLAPKPKLNPQELAGENRALRQAIAQSVTGEESKKREYMERVGELIEARQMAGSGPWQVGPEVLKQTDQLIKAAYERLESPGVRLQENYVTAVGAGADLNLALENVEWRREINLSWLEFSRWGIQQIILVSRLWFVKNPLIQRGITVCANYVFGRGVEVMSEDDDANSVLMEFFERNKATLGQGALGELQKRLFYDGQVFYVFFADELDKGKTTVRTIDATEIFEIITDSDDTDQPHFYHRKWVQRNFDVKTGATSTKSMEAYYPALGWEATPADKAVSAINSYPIVWETPMLMQKGGIGIGKWHFDTPRTYAALDWARNSRRLLEADLSTRMALSQFAFTLTTKGGQQALEGAKQQMGTTAGPVSGLWDMNPPAVTGSTFGSGPGTTLSAFNTQGAIRDPSDVKEYRAMVAIVFEIPPTFLGDLETANLATATSLDRPTELAMLEKQERWRETLVTIAKYVLTVSQGAPSGKLREAEKHDWRVIECARKRKKDGTWIYEASRKKGNIEIKVNFPAIREGDMPANVKAISEAMTLDNKGGQIVGIDEKVGVGLLYEQLGVEDYGDILDDQYPADYDPDRTKEPLPAPVQKALPDPGGAPQLPGGTDPPPPVKAAERFIRALSKVLG